MSQEMSEWLDHVEKFANDPSPTNYLRLIVLTEATMGSMPPVARFLGTRTGGEGAGAGPAPSGGAGALYSSSASWVRPASSSAGILGTPICQLNKWEMKSI
jgi:hypothetical protein